MDDTDTIRGLITELNRCKAGWNRDRSELIRTTCDIKKITEHRLSEGQMYRCVDGVLMGAPLVFGDTHLTGWVKLSDVLKVLKAYRLEGARSHYVEQGFGIHGNKNRKEYGGEEDCTGTV